MHLAVEAGDMVRRCTGVVEDGDGIVVESGRTALEEAGDQRDLLLAHDGGQTRGAGAGDRFCKSEEGMILALAEVLRTE